MFTKEEIASVFDGASIAIFSFGMLCFICGFGFHIGAIAIKENTYAEGYLQGQIDYRKGWINIKQDTLTNWKLK